MIIEQLEQALRDIIVWWDERHHSAEVMPEPACITHARGLVGAPRRVLPQAELFVPVGDRNARYEFHCWDVAGLDVLIGWSDDPNMFKRMVEIHPTWKNWRLIDRKAEPAESKPVIVNRI